MMTWETLKLEGGGLDGGWTLSTPSGEVPLTFLGSGAFSRVYVKSSSIDSSVYAMVRDPGLDKKAMALAKKLAPENVHLPDVRRIGRVEDFSQWGYPDDGGDLYTMPLYKTGRDFRDFLNAESQRFYERLRECLPGGQVDLDVAADCLRRKRFRGEQKQAIDVLLQAAYEVWLDEGPDDDAYFDLPERNIASNYFGDLILLDPIFYVSNF